MDKSKFINTCDAMIHARMDGETFGLAVAEFSMHNKPVLTFGRGTDWAHIEILKDKALVYNSFEDVYDMLLNLNKYIKHKNYIAYNEFLPENVMQIFRKVFLD